MHKGMAPPQGLQLSSLRSMRYVSTPASQKELKGPPTLQAQAKFLRTLDLAESFPYLRCQLNPHAWARASAVDAPALRGAKLRARWTCAPTGLECLSTLPFSRLFQVISFKGCAVLQGHRPPPPHAACGPPGALRRRPPPVPRPRSGAWCGAWEASSRQHAPGRSQPSAFLEAEPSPSLAVTPCPLASAERPERRDAAAPTRPAATPTASGAVQEAPRSTC